MIVEQTALVPNWLREARANLDPLWNRKLDTLMVTRK